jgi:hypothetical protein
MDPRLREDDGSWLLRILAQRMDPGLRRDDGWWLLRILSAVS